MKASGRMTLLLIACGFVFACLSAVPSFSQQHPTLADSINDGKPFFIDFNNIETPGGALVNARYSGYYCRKSTPSPSPNTDCKKGEEDVWHIYGPVKGGNPKGDTGGCGPTAAHQNGPPCPVPVPTSTQARMISIWGGTYSFENNGKIYNGGTLVGSIELEPESSNPPQSNGKGGGVIAVLTLAALAGVSTIRRKRS